jgi:hypothetical protein
MKTVSMRGVKVDFAAHIAKNEKAVAVGNARMNARGDKLGRGGKIVQTRAPIVADYYKSPNAVKKVPLAELNEEVFQSPADALAQAKAEGARVPQRGRKRITDSED